MFTLNNIILNCQFVKNTFDFEIWVDQDGLHAGQAKNPKCQVWEEESKYWS